MTKKRLPYKTSKEAAEDIITSDKSSSDHAAIRSLSADADWREVAVVREKQRITLRTKAYEHSVAVCLSLFAYLVVMALLVWLGKPSQFSDQAQLAIFGTPIIAIAAITIFILRGVFNGFSEKSVTDDNQALNQVAQTAIDAGGS